MGEPTSKPAAPAQSAGLFRLNRAAKARLPRPSKPKSWLGLATLAWALVSVLALLARQTRVAFAPLAVLAAFIPYLLLAGVFVLVLLLLRRRWRWAGGAALLVAALLATQVPQLRASPAPELGASQSLVLLSANLKLGRVDLGQVNQLVRDHQVGVVVFTELTPEARQQATDVGLDAQLPFIHAVPQAGAAGTGIWSRYPLTQVSPISGMSSVNLVSTINLAPPGQPARSLSVVAAHPTTVFYPLSWAEQVPRLRTAAASLPDPVVIAGDFNATPDMPAVSTLTALGYRNASDELGQGWAFTWAPLVGMPEMLRLDHVLLRGQVKVNQLQRHHLEGSDHQAVLARLQVELPQS